MCPERAPASATVPPPAPNPGTRDGFAPGLLPAAAAGDGWGTLGQATGVGGHREGRVVLEEGDRAPGRRRQGGEQPWDSELLGCI